MIMHRLTKDNLLRIYLKKKEFSFLFFNLLLRSKYIKRFFKRNVFRDILVHRFGRIRNICVITGRGRSVYRSFRSSRHILKGMSHLSYLPGVKKSS
jgi:ribosomal protein S14